MAENTKQNNTPQKEEAQIMYELRMLQAQSEQGQKQLEALQQAAAEARNALATLSSLSEAKGESILPIGGGVFLKTKGIDGASVLVEIGAGVIAEKSVAEAQKIIIERSQKLEEAVRKIASELERMAYIAQQKSDELQKMREQA